MKNLWNEKMSVGIRQFDEHHKKIIDMIYTLSQRVDKGITREELNQIIHELSSYVRYHFNAEERIMETYNYEEIEVHKNEHRIFAIKLEKLTDQFVSSSEDISKKLLLFLKDWFVNHILQTDRKYGMYLNKRGVS